MTLANNEVCVGWLHENCYFLRRVEHMLRVRVYWGGRFFLVGVRISKLSASGGGGVPSIPPVGKTLGIKNLLCKYQSQRKKLDVVRTI